MTKVYFNHDGSVDDLVPLFLLLQMENVELVGASTIGTDCYLEPSLSASLKIVDRFSDVEINVAPSRERGENPFPKEWRMHALSMDALPVLNGSCASKRCRASEDKAHIDITRKMKSCDEKVALLFTRPSTDLVKAIKHDNSILKNIEKLVWMGGTLLDKGNVEEPEHDGTAEWDAFQNPEAVKVVLDSSMNVDIVASENTNQVPLTMKVRQMWADKRQYLGVDFLGTSYAIVPPLIYSVTNSTYFLWDVLTTTYVDSPNLVKSTKLKTDVISRGPSQGRTSQSEYRCEAQVTTDINKQAFFNYITDLAKKIEP